MVGGFECLGYGPVNEPFVLRSEELLRDFRPTEESDQDLSHHRLLWASSISISEPTPTTGNLGSLVSELPALYLEVSRALFYQHDLIETLCAHYSNKNGSLVTSDSAYQSECTSVQTPKPPILSGCSDTLGFSTSLTASATRGTRVSYANSNSPNWSPPMEFYFTNNQATRYMHILPRELSPLSINATKTIDFVLAQCEYPLHFTARSKLMVLN